MASILVADDSALIRDMAQSILRGAGHEVHLAENGRSALRLFERTAIDVVILDIFMPVMDGLEAIQAIRTVSPGTPIITISSGGTYNDMSYLHMAREFGAFTCIRKPLDPQTLCVAVEQALRSKRGAPVPAA